MQGESFMMSPFFNRCICVGILLTFIFLSGCAYQQYMSQEQTRRVNLTEQLGNEQARSAQLAGERQILQEEIRTLNDQIRNIQNEIANQNDEICKLQQKTTKLNNDIVQIRKRQAQVERLQDQIKAKQQALALKKAEVQKISQ
jgi:peptidoglycan hydrolase CwlO-like protein